jgi:Uncharacterised nucleotidyltransferase
LTNPWPTCAPLPRHAAAVLSALHLTDPDREILARLTEREWRDALDYADRERLTLALREACSPSAPGWVRERLDRNAAANEVRMRGIAASYRQIAERLGGEGLEFVFLKGMTHAPLFGLPAASRVQYDIDLWLPPDHALRAQRLLMASGYESMPGTEELPTDHLPALVRKTGWQWRGDFFDPEIPLPVELHVQFWNPKQERFEAPGAEDFPRRRTTRSIDGQTLPTLCPEDAAGYAALHVLRHVLTGSVRLFHVYEIAAMLHARAGDTRLWQSWQRLHPPELRRLEAIAFRLAREWFGGAAAPEVEEELALLPRGARVWFDVFALSPAVLGFRPNKDHLWLHLTLLDSRRDAWQVALQRILPLRLPAAAGDAFVAEGDLSWRDWLRWRIRWAAHALGRAWHHARALPVVAISAVRWLWCVRRIPE